MVMAFAVVYSVGLLGQPTGWTNLLGNAVGTLIAVFVVGRLLGLWPESRFLHWHRPWLPHKPAPWPSAVKQPVD
jgi:hypothetical protein